MSISYPCHRSFHQPLQEFLCAINGHIMKQPARSPHGHVFELSTILLWLESRGLLCPLTGKPLRKGTSPNDERPCVSGIKNNPLVYACCVLHGTTVGFSTTCTMPGVHTMYVVLRLMLKFTYFVTSYALVSNQL